LEESSAVAGRMTGVWSAPYLLIVSCCYLCGPVLCRGVPALRKKEHGNYCFCYLLNIGLFIYLTVSNQWTMFDLLYNYLIF